MDVQVNMPVKNSLNEEIGSVVGGDDQYLEIVTSADNQHHWVPVSLIDHVDAHVHLSGSGDDLAVRWLNKNPDAFKQAMVDEASKESFPASDPPSFNPQKS